MSLGFVREKKGLKRRISGICIFNRRASSHLTNQNLCWLPSKWQSCFDWLATFAYCSIWKVQSGSSQAQSVPCGPPRQFILLTWRRKKTDLELILLKYHSISRPNYISCVSISVLVCFIRILSLKWLFKDTLNPTFLETKLYFRSNLKSYRTRLYLSVYCLQTGKSRWAVLAVFTW